MLCSSLALLHSYFLRLSSPFSPEVGPGAWLHMIRDKKRKDEPHMLLASASETIICSSGRSHPLLPCTKVVPDGLLQAWL